MVRHKYRIPKLEELEVGGMFTFATSNVLNKIIEVGNDQVVYTTNVKLVGNLQKPPSDVPWSLSQEYLHLIDHWMGPSEVLIFDTLEEYKEAFENDYKTCLRSELIVVMGYVVADEKYEVTISPSCLEKIKDLTTIRQYRSAFPGYPEHAKNMFDYMSKWNQLPIF